VKPSPPASCEEHAVKCELAGEVLRSFGRLRLQVTGWSMLPSIWPGDTLLLERVPTDGIAEGDIILFGRDRRLFAHRVVRVCGVRGILTQGDAMTQMDLPVRENEFLGRVSSIVRNGRLVEPRRSLSFGERVVAAMVRRSGTVARVLVGAYTACVEFRQFTLGNTRCLPSTVDHSSPTSHPRD